MGMSGVENKVVGVVAIQIDSAMIGEMYLRQGPQADISGWIENVVRDYLERTADEGSWSEAYYKYRERQADTQDFAREFGDPKEGYHWAPLFLPNGTTIRMEYKREAFYAMVKFGKIHFKDNTYSPSELARAIAVGKAGLGTSRNAWRDLYIKRPGDPGWVLADDLRRPILK